MSSRYENAMSDLEANNYTQPYPPKIVTTEDNELDRKLHILVCDLLGLDDEDHEDDNESYMLENAVKRLIASEVAKAELALLDRIDKSYSVDIKGQDRFILLNIVSALTNEHNILKGKK